MYKLRQSIFGYAALMMLAIVCINNATAETDIEFLDRVNKDRDILRPTDAIVIWGSVAAPVGHFLLIRKDKEMCAVLFKNFRRGNDAKPTTVFSTGEEHLYADYDWYLQNDGSGDFTKENVKQGQAKVAYGPHVGFAGWLKQTTNQRVSCGSIKLNWIYPDDVRFFSGNKLINTGIELAPSAWSTISEVLGNDSNLTWYQMDQNRVPTLIPISDLKK